MTLRRKLFVIAVVYVVEGFPMGVFTGLLPFFQSEAGYSLATIGALSAFGWFWSLKALWSPLVSRYGERRHWIVASQLVMAAALLGVATLADSPYGVLVGLAIAGYCAASATQDIAIDAYTIGMLDSGEEGPGNAMRNTGYRLGMALLANALFFLPRFVGWSMTFVAAAALHTVMALSVLAVPRIEVPAETRRDMWRATRIWLSQPGVVAVFAFVAFYRIGDLAMAPMIAPFWESRGFAREEFATVSGMLGLLAMLPGSWCAAVIVTRIGIGRTLLLTGVLALVSNLGYAAAAAWPETGRTTVYAASIAESFCSGMAGVAFMSFLMRICQKEHAAVQYALLTAVYALIGRALGAFSGVITEPLGFGGYFAVTAAFALPAFLFLPAARRWVDPEPAP